jgi:hypothetical protein
MSPSKALGAFATSLANLGVPLDYHLVPKDALPPDPDDSLIVMGGSVSNLVSIQKRQPRINAVAQFCGGKSLWQAGRRVSGVS